MSSNSEVSFVQFVKMTAMGILGIVALCAVYSSFYTVPEGHVGIVKRFGEAMGQESPGLQFKVPFIDDVEEIEVRTRKNEESMASATAEQMPVQVKVSVNWTVEKSAALDLFKQYGGLGQFESRILDPRFRSATKDALPKYTAEQMVQNRGQVIALIEENLKTEMVGFPVTVDNIQIENLALPPKYLQSIEAKQTAKNLAAAENHKLAQQALQAQQAVNTANAKRDSTKALADGQAYATLEQAKAEAESIALKGKAEATAIKAKAQVLKNNPLIVQLTHEQQWDGKLPEMVMGDAGNILLGLKDR